MFKHIRAKFIIGALVLVMCLFVASCDKVPNIDGSVTLPTTDAATDADSVDTADEATESESGEIAESDDTAEAESAAESDATSEEITEAVTEEEQSETIVETEPETVPETIPETEPETEPETQPATQPTTKTYVWVICHSLNIRDNPVLAEGNVLGTASNGDKFEVLEKAATYTKIVYNGGVAYISAKPEYVSFTEPETTTPDPTPTPTPTNYVWINCESLNVRDNPVLASGNVLGTVGYGDKFEVLEKAETYTKISYNGTEAYISAKTEYVSFTTPTYVEVIRKIIYAVETGGQVYGNADYNDFTEAYANSSAEHAITIGAGQWYATEAKRLLNLIRTTDPALFAQLDTAGIAADLDSADWSTYKLSKDSAKAKCIQAIINTPVGHACQDRLIEDQMLDYIKKARSLGVTDLKALLMCANIRHQGGNGALTRVLGKTAKPYTLDNIYAALATDTGNQVGAYKNRQKMVYESLNKYL